MFVFSISNTYKTLITVFVLAQQGRTRRQSPRPHEEPGHSLPHVPDARGERRGVEVEGRQGEERVPFSQHVQERR